MNKLINLFKKDKEKPKLSEYSDYEFNRDMMASQFHHMVSNLNNPIRLLNAYIKETFYCIGSDDFSNIYILEFNAGQVYQIYHTPTLAYISVYDKNIYFDCACLEFNILLLEQYPSCNNEYNNPTAPFYFNLKLMDSVITENHILKLDIPDEVVILIDEAGELSVRASVYNESLVTKRFYLKCCSILSGKDEHSKVIMDILNSELEVVNITFPTKFIFPTPYGSLLFNSGETYRFKLLNKVIIVPEAYPNINMAKYILDLLHSDWNEDHDISIAEHIKFVPSVEQLFFSDSNFLLEEK